MSFSTVSDQDDGRLIKTVCNGAPAYGSEDFASIYSSGERTRSARSVGQRLTHGATGAPVSFEDSDWVTIWVVLLPERTETDGPYYRIGPDCADCA